MNVDVVIPAYRPGQKFIRLITMLDAQTVRPDKIIVMNTEEKWWSERLMEQLGQAAARLEVHHLSKEDFDHAGTRNEGISHSEAAYVVLMTDDAIPYDTELLSHLLAPFSDPEVSAVYARQLAGEKAKIAERFSREFNYPDRSEKKSLKDMERLGIKTFFCSNVCAAYRRDLYDRLGGFAAPAIFNEDMVYASGLLDQGYAVYYAADAKVIHSHAYSNRQQLSRNFDLAVSQALHPEVFDRVRSESEGLRFVCRALTYFTKHGRPFAILPFMITTVNKYYGYRMGRRFLSLSRDQILKYTMNPGFFEKMWSEEAKDDGRIG
ncbi:MAG: glycosyltransferase family 2 protein [Lachnospiraceae bacterium]|nr:glycosyltransferase family 2 protein [Lachnospiraceae bacterium]